jgi:acyl carrier protein
MADVWQRTTPLSHQQERIHLFEELPPQEEVGDRAAPRGAIEQAVAALFTELLGHERIGVDDNFFALGGHSLLAARLVALVRKDFQVELTLLDLFDNPTVAGVAAFIEGVSGAVS